MQERQRSWSAVRDWWVSMRRRTGVGSNSIFCNGCKHWVHKKCSGLKRLTKDPDFRCTQFQGTARPLDGRPQKEVQVGPEKLEVVASFCYLGDRLSAAGGCELSTTTSVKTAWKEVQGSATSSLFMPSLFQNVAVCTALVCGAQCSMQARLGHRQSQTSSVCSEMTEQWSDRSAMSGRKILSPPGPMSYLWGLALRIWTSFWSREDSDGMEMWNVPMVQSRQPLTYKLIESVDLVGPRWHESSWQWKLSATNPHDRRTWRSGVRSAMRAASQLSGRGPTEVDVAPIPAC